MEDYKTDIINTRKGCLGGSDSKMLAQIDSLGSVPRSAYKRLAVCKGLIEPENVTTQVMKYGDFIEQQLFEYLHANDNRYQSNPCLVSEAYSTSNVKIIDHVDFMLQDDENKVLYLYECKASKFTIEQVRDMYKAQLFHHWLLGSEMAKKLGKYKVQVMLVHYDTRDVDMDEEWSFDPTKITVRHIRFSSPVFNMARAVGIISEFLDNFTEFYDGEEIESVYLPEKVKQEFDMITNVLAEIKEREKKVSKFKEYLFAFMESHDIKSIKNEAWSITRIDATESRNFDYKAFLGDYATKHPRLYNKLVRDYEKVVKRKGSVQIRLKDNNN